MAYEQKQGQGPQGGGNRDNRGGNRDNRGGQGGHQTDSEREGMIDRLVHIGRVSKTVKGGRRFTFAALVVVGDGKGKIGFGTGKAKEVQDAVKKATDTAKKAMIRIPLRESRTLHHDVKGRYGAGRVVLRSAPAGTGIIAGGPMRAIFEALGVHDVVAKSTGTSNPHNMIKATFNALKLMNSPRLVATRRSMKVGEVVERREAGAKAAGVHNEAE
jgi:small subunit ribosomal protein S5